jgi:hypothetical protein
MDLQQCIEKARDANNHGSFA